MDSTSFLITHALGTAPARFRKISDWIELVKILVVLHSNLFQPDGPLSIAILNFLRTTAQMAQTLVRNAERIR